MVVVYLIGIPIAAGYVSEVDSDERYDVFGASVYWPVSLFAVILVFFFKMIWQILVSLSKIGRWLATKIHGETQ
jgi:hypothetical protein